MLPRGVVGTSRAPRDSENAQCYSSDLVMPTTNIGRRMYVVRENVCDGLRVRGLLNADHCPVIIHADQEEAGGVRSNCVGEGEDVLRQARLTLWLLQIVPLALELNEVGLASGDKFLQVLCREELAEVLGPRTAVRSLPRGCGFTSQV